jgi:hypothetical protein
MPDASIILDLIVIVPFGPYNRGDAIINPTEIAAVLVSNSRNVVQIPQEAGQPTGSTPPPEPTPPPPPAPPPPPPIPNGAGTAFVLSVITPFGDYNRGDQITSPQAIADALAGNPGCVVMVAPTPEETQSHGL